MFSAAAGSFGLHNGGGELGSMSTVDADDSDAILAGFRGRLADWPVCEARTVSTWARTGLCADSFEFDQRRAAAVLSGAREKATAERRTAQREASALRRRDEMAENARLRAQVRARAAQRSKEREGAVVAIPRLAPPSLGPRQAPRTARGPERPQPQPQPPRTPRAVQPVARRVRFHGKDGALGAPLLGSAGGGGWCDGMGPHGGAAPQQERQPRTPSPPSSSSASFSSADSSDESVGEAEAGIDAATSSGRESGLLVFARPPQRPRRGSSGYGSGSWTHPEAPAKPTRPVCQSGARPPRSPCMPPAPTTPSSMAAAAASWTRAMGNSTPDRPPLSPAPQRAEALVDSSDDTGPKDMDTTNAFHSTSCSDGRSKSATPLGNGWGADATARPPSSGTPTRPGSQGRHKTDETIFNLSPIPNRRDGVDELPSSAGSDMD